MPLITLLPLIIPTAQQSSYWHLKSWKRPHRQGSRYMRAYVKASFFFYWANKTMFQGYVPLATSLAKASFVMFVEGQNMPTLMQLRMGLLLVVLAFHLPMSSALVSQIFSSWVPHLAELSRKYLIFWLSTETIWMSLPDVSKDLSQTTCIANCFEIFSDRPQNLLRKILSFYKSHNTIKVINEVAPNGFIIFISKASGGRASDCYITANSVFFL